MANRWFYFTATSSQIRITVDINGSKGTQSRTQVAIWESDGLTEVESKRYQSNEEDVTIGAVNLTPGQRYYISVDVVNLSYDGTFTLCVTDEVDYDFYEGAIELTNLDNYVSANAEYTTLGATPDRNAGSNWNTGGNPVANRWFKFTAISENVTIKIDINGSKGNQSRTQLALWEADGLTEVNSIRYVGNNDDVFLSQGGLTIGNVYYISVDVVNLSYDGTFTLEVDNVDQSYFAISDGDWDDPNTWSLVGFGGTPAADYPQIGDIANIRDYDVTFNTSETVGGINIDNVSDTGSLTVSSATLTVQGAVNITNTGVNFPLYLTINNGSVSINDDLTIQRDGGADSIKIVLNNGDLDINRNFTWDINGGTNEENVLIANNASSITIGENFNLNNNTGTKILNQFNNTSTLTVVEDIVYNVSSQDLAEIEFNNSTSLNAGGDFTRAGGFGILDMNDNAILRLNSTTNLQIFPQNAGSGTDTFTFENVVINNSRITFPQVTLEGDVSIPGTIVLSDGLVATSTSALLTMEAGSVLSGGSNASFIQGPLRKIGNTDFEFQIGDENVWAPLDIANLTGDAATEFTATYFFEEPTNNTVLRTSDPNGNLNNVSSVEYWDLTPAGTASNADVTLHWKNQVRSGIDNYADLVVAHYTGSEWENYGQNSRVSADPGSITVTNIPSFSPFTFGSTSPAVNPLPVELAYFTATTEVDGILLKWKTLAEINNSHFEIQKSLDGQHFKSIGEVEGNGTINYEHFYSYFDKAPVSGYQYYRLKQMDYDGQYEYSPIVIAHYEGASSITFYPNPVSSGGTLDFNSNDLKIKAVVMYDQSGKLIRSITADANQIQINLPNLPEGLYFVEINTEVGFVREKLMVF